MKEASRAGPAGAMENASPSEIGIHRERRDAELAQEGWIRRFIESPPRLQHTVDLYEGMGHEVLLDPVSAEDLGKECSDCALALTLFRVVYTRNPK